MSVRHAPARWKVACALSAPRMLQLSATALIGHARRQRAVQPMDMHNAPRGVRRSDAAAQRLRTTEAGLIHCRCARQVPWAKNTRRPMSMFHAVVQQQVPQPPTRWRPPSAKSYTSWPIPLMTDSWRRAPARLAARCSCIYR